MHEDAFRYTAAISPRMQKLDTSGENTLNVSNAVRHSMGANFSTEPHHADDA